MQIYAARTEPPQVLPEAAEIKLTAKQQSKLTNGKAAGIKTQAVNALLHSEGDQALADESDDASDDEEAEAQRRWARMRWVHRHTTRSTKSVKVLAERASLLFAIS